MDSGEVVNNKESKLRVHPYWGSLAAAGVMTILGIVLLLEVGFSADARAESLPEWRYLVPWGVLGTGLAGLIALGMVAASQSRRSYTRSHGELHTRQ